MVKEIRCPVQIHEKEVMAVLTIEPMMIKYQDVNYLIDRYFYKCPECGVQFTTDELDEITMGQIPNSIWSKALEEKNNGQKF